MFTSELSRCYSQAAVYGLGVCAEFGGSVIKPLIGGNTCLHTSIYNRHFLLHILCRVWFLLFFLYAEALSRLNVVIRHPNALQPEYVMAYDNAVSALGKICQFHRDSIDSAQVFVS